MLGQKGFIIQQRDFALLRIKNELFISRAGEHTPWGYDKQFITKVRAFDNRQISRQ